MITQATGSTSQEAGVGTRRLLSPQEIERITQPLYERSVAEMKAEWSERFQNRRKEFIQEIHAESQNNEK